MLKITKPSANRIEIVLSGAVDAEAMRTGLDKLIADSEGVQNGVMLYKISDPALPTLGAIGVEIGRLPQLFGLLGKYDKCAVLSDSGWLRKAASIEGALFPGLDIKSFEFDEQDKAERWLAGEASA
jgi:hypothetical protein